MSDPSSISDQPKKTARIYAMPEKFFVEDRRSGGKNTFLVVIIIILAVITLGGGAYFFIQRSSGSNNNTTNENTNQASNSMVTNTGVNKNTNKVSLNNNGGLNINATTNGNASNLNLFTNTNTNTVSNVNNTVVASSQDTDTDGLTDVEEGLYGTSISIADTDGDSYIDGQEIASGYDPLNKGGALSGSAAARLYTDSQDGYSLLYPAAWVPADDPQDTRAKIFTASGEFVEVSIQENPAGLSARDWYLTKSPGIDSARVMSVTNWDKTLSGALSLDGLTVYYTKGDKAYIVTYNINILTQANYKTTFQMMYRSFTLGSTATNTNQTANTNTTNGNRNTNTNTNRNTNTNSNSNRNANANSNTNTTNGNANSNTNNSNHL